jgi:pimeloyl-ACP methyl ester carboxylesterase
LPGYVFSQTTQAAGMDPPRMAQILAGLMAALGYDRYGAVGGDWGSIVASFMGIQDPTHCIGTEFEKNNVHVGFLIFEPGVHLHFLVAPAPTATIFQVRFPGRHRMRVSADIVCSEIAHGTASRAAAVVSLSGRRSTLGAPQRFPPSRSRLHRHPGVPFFISPHH